MWPTLMAVAVTPTSVFPFPWAGPPGTGAAAEPGEGAAAPDPAADAWLPPPDRGATPGVADDAKREAADAGTLPPGVTPDDDAATPGLPATEPALGTSGAAVPGSDGTAAAPWSGATDPLGPPPRPFSLSRA